MMRNIALCRYEFSPEFKQNDTRIDLSVNINQIKRQIEQKAARQPKFFRKFCIYCLVTKCRLFKSSHF